jgi:prolyl-tRNA synthetase
LEKLTKRADNYAQWYNDLVIKAGLAEHSAVRGCMVIKPYGYSIWERIQQDLDRRFKETGHQNAYFPLLVPKSFFNKEASHVEGFAKECAVVTHYRLMQGEGDAGLIVDPDSKLEEELIVRPTSETIIWSTYKNWVQSYRDLPILINQWANVVRWEMRTRLFLRTTEFLWQEGHTAHATQGEAMEEALRMLDVYSAFAEQMLAMPVIKGVKTANERFAGAIDTFCIEALMQDGKALQAGTSHFLGQNFAKAFDVKFMNKDGQLDYVWATSWGVSTRLMGALIMTHSDDNGLVLPPSLAPQQIVVIPIYRTDEEFQSVAAKCREISDKLAKTGLRVKLDDDDKRKPGWKFSEYEFRGVPIRIAVGPRDLENNTVEIARRDTLEKAVYPTDNLVELCSDLIAKIQRALYEKALEYREINSHKVDRYEDLKEIVAGKGGFVYAHWDGTDETELKIKEETKATIRCIPSSGGQEQGTCIYSGKPSSQRVIFAQAY